MLQNVANRNQGKYTGSQECTERRKIKLAEEEEEDDAVRISQIKGSKEWFNNKDMRQLYEEIRKFWEELHPRTCKK